jgi:hypothetical protein
LLNYGCGCSIMNIGLTMPLRGTFPPLLPDSLGLRSLSEDGLAVVRNFLLFTLTLQS